MSSTSPIPHAFNNLLKLPTSFFLDQMQDEDPKGRSLMISRHVLLPEEVNAIKGVLSMTEKRVEDLMIPIDKVYMVSSDQVLDEATLSAIDRIGHSRIPVFKNDNKNIITG